METNKKCLICKKNAPKQIFFCEKCLSKEKKLKTFDARVKIIIDLDKERKIRSKKKKQSI